MQWRRYAIIAALISSPEIHRSAAGYDQAAVDTCSNGMSRMPVKLISRKHRINIARWYL